MSIMSEIAAKGHETFLMNMQTGKSGGCWFEIYEDTGFGGKSLRLDGPSEYKKLKTLPGSDMDWGDKIGSNLVGPNASAVVYDDEDFGGDHIDHYGPNTRTDVSGDLDDNIDSLRIYQA